MEKKYSYLKELWRTKDLFLSIVVGLFFGFAVFFVEKYNWIGQFFPSQVHFLKPMYWSFLIALLVFFYGAILMRMKSKKVLLMDSMLFGLESFSLVGLGSFISLQNTFAIVLFACSFVCGLLLLVKRNFYVEEESKETTSRDYHALIARKYDYAFIVILGFCVSLISLYYMDAMALLEEGKIYYVIGALFAFDLVVLFASAFRGKKAKVSCLDAVLLLLEVIILFSGAFYFTLKGVPDFTKIGENQFVDHHLLQTLFMLSFAFTFLTIIVRSYVVSVHVPYLVQEKTTSNYYGSLFQKYPRFFPQAIGIVLAFLMNFMSSSIQESGKVLLDEVFNFGMENEIRIPFFLAIFLALCIFALLVVGLLQRGFFNKKINLFDVAIFILTIASAGSSIMLISDGVTLLRCVLIFVPLGVGIGLSLFRILFLAKDSPEPIADDEVQVKVKVVVSDQEEVKATSDTAKVNYVVEKEIAENEIAEEKEEEMIPLKEENKKFQFHGISRSMRNKLCFLSDSSKNYYNELKNTLLSYKIRSRMTKRAECFRKGGLIAKIVVMGKSLRLHLALDPNDYDIEKYHQKDFSEKKTFKEVPFGMKIRSKLSLKRAKELIAILMEERQIKKKKDYVYEDYTKDLIVDGKALLERVGALSSLKEIATLEDAENLSDNILKFIPKIQKEKPKSEEVNNVYLDTALKYVENEISYETLHAVQQIPASKELIHLKARTGLSKKITVFVDSYDKEAVKLVLLTGGMVYQIIRK